MDLNVFITQIYIVFIHQWLSIQMFIVYVYHMVLQFYFSHIVCNLLQHANVIVTRVSVVLLSFIA